MQYMGLNRGDNGIDLNVINIQLHIIDDVRSCNLYHHIMNSQYFFELTIRIMINSCNIICANIDEI